MTDKPSRRDVPRPASAGPTKFGPYWLDSRIAVGGTAEVYLAHPTDARVDPKVLVVKRLLPHFVNDPEGRTMFEREAKLHAAVQHENVVTVFGSGVAADGEPYLAMEYIDGVDCFRLLRRLTQEGRTMPAGVAVHVAREVLRALGSVHSARDAAGTPLGIIHRDVTPSNIYLSKDGKVKLGDFGIARSATRATLKNAEGTLLKGKFAYLAPEQVAGDVFDHRADLFSMAAVLVEMLIGKPLFSGTGQLSVLLAIRDCRLDPVVEAKGRLPKGLFEVLSTALSREPQGRYQSASAFAAALAPSELPSDKARQELATLVSWAQAISSSNAMAAVRESAQALRAVRANLTTSKKPPPPPPPTPSSPALTAAAAGKPLKAPEIHLDLEPDPDSHDPGRPTPRVDLRTELGLDDEDTEQGNEHDRDTGEYSRLPSFVENGRGERLGPWAYARLVEALATGQVGRGDRVDYMGRGLAPVEDIEELQRFLPAKTATTSQVKGPGAPDMSDDLAAVGMLEILIRIMEQGESGVLFVERPADGDAEAGRKELYFVDGKLHTVASSNASELLGRYLVRRNVLSKDELDFALAVLPRYGGRMGDTLISLGLVSAVDIFRAIREQGRDRVADLFLWKHGPWSFYRGQAAPHVEFPLDLDLPGLLLAGVEAADPSDAPMEAFRPRMEAKLTAAPARGHRSEGLSWPGLLGKVRTAAATPRKLRDVVAALSKPGETNGNDVLRAVRVLEAAGLVTLQG